MQVICQYFYQCIQILVERVVDVFSDFAATVIKETVNHNSFDLWGLEIE